ncbi:MAG TPA: hypothetical protein VI566_15915 [Xanthomonadales bacterium]|nr:hypothetical protein [Xanthomonadales bacterium]
MKDTLADPSCTGWCSFDIAKWSVLVPVLFRPLIYPGARNMSKELKTKKEAKKKPALSMKEKRAAKKAKKESRT